MHLGLGYNNFFHGIGHTYGRYETDEVKRHDFGGFVIFLLLSASSQFYLMYHPRSDCQFSKRVTDVSSTIGYTFCNV